MLWIKSFHIIFVISWFAGLFYLPRLFVNHAMVLSSSAPDSVASESLKLMERKLYRFMLPLALLALGFGIWLWRGYGFSGGWIHAKLTLVVVLIGYHFYCGKLVNDFSRNQNKHSHIWYRWFNELPVLVLTAIVILTVVKPF
ncbi:MAG: CopD family protein [Methylotenera sp.]|nr:CopD family protein [Methylotenera sp.]MDO9388568.1 CopD family protein [Methylotenera sp.]MDP2101378.1 CopD family protein [Methylotenera sp.]MDP2281561.1 CopD family protein [Methylotenera sp.]MDP2404381.1 CopD family protein [Methylotenera sp.]